MSGRAAARVFQVPRLGADSTSFQPVGMKELPLMSTDPARRDVQSRAESYRLQAVVLSAARRGGAPQQLDPALRKFELTEELHRVLRSIGAEVGRQVGPGCG